MTRLTLYQKFFFAGLASLPIGFGLWLWSLYGVEILLSEAARFCF